MLPVTPLRLVHEINTFSPNELRAILWLIQITGSFPFHTYIHMLAL
jgi:hypothetical protein